MLQKEGKTTHDIIVIYAYSYLRAKKK